MLSAVNLVYVLGGTQGQVYCVVHPMYLQRGPCLDPVRVVYACLLSPHS